MKKITLIDLNNFAYYPTLSIGYLIAILRKSGLQVELLSPLRQGVIAKKREPIENKLHYLEQRIRLSDNRTIQTTLRKVKEIPDLFNLYYNKGRILNVVKKDLAPDVDLILISSYLESYFVCKEIAAYAREKNIPVIIGGPAFNIASNAEKWIKINGVNAVVGVEADEFLGQMTADFLDGKSIDHYPGVYSANKPKTDASYIFNKMNELPLPDFSDFPWEKYPVKIIPYMTARGCGWAKCNFCTDVTLVNGRTFRSMKAQKVLRELKKLSEIHETNYFYFIDIKLNSELAVWNALIHKLKRYVKNPKWACSVHVDGYKENGLTREELFKAKEGGLLRITFGLESGSQRLLNHMKKGTKLERIKQFITDVHDAGISLRGTMFLGYPYETEEDLRLTHEFLQEYGDYFDRIRICRFGIFESAPIYQQVKKDYEEFVKTSYNNCYAIDRLVDRGKDYGFYKKGIIKKVHRINSTPLIEEARAFEGVM